MRRALTIAKAVGDESRVRALVMLRGGELCVCQIIDALDLSPATVSRHLTILHQAGLVERRKRGKWAFYRLAGRKAPAEIRGLLRWLFAALEHDPQVEADEASAGNARATDPAQLSGCYRGFSSA